MAPASAGGVRVLVRQAPQPYLLVMLKPALLWLIAAFVWLGASPSVAFNLFATHEVTAQFATPDGKPLANAEVRVFAPGDASKPAVTGKTDSDGKFVFEADRDGFWSAEARTPDQIARIMIHVGGESQSSNRFSPFFVIGVLAILLAIAIWYRLLRARQARRRP
jgi:nickel transport protein